MSVKSKMMRMMFDWMGLPTCEEVEKFAYDFLDEVLDAKTTKAVERHLKTCKNCQKFITSYRKVAKKIRPASPPPLEKEFQEKIISFLSQQRRNSHA